MTHFHAFPSNRPWKCQGGLLMTCRKMVWNLILEKIWKALRLNREQSFLKVQMWIQMCRHALHPLFVVAVTAGMDVCSVPSNDVVWDLIGQHNCDTPLVISAAKYTLDHRIQRSPSHRWEKKCHPGKPWNTKTPGLIRKPRVFTQTRRFLGYGRSR